MTRIRILAACALAMIVGTTAQAQTLNIGTAQVGSLSNAVGTGLGKVLSEHAGLRVRVVPFGGGQQFLPLIGKQEIDLAVAGGSDALFAYRGVADFDGNPSPSLRAVGVVFPFIIGWFVKKDAPYRSMVELKGKRVPVGFTANSAQQRSFLATLAADGLKPEDFDGVPVAHVVRAADDFMQGKVEATTFAMGAAKVAEADAKVGGIRWLSIADTPEALKRMREHMPTAYVGIVQPRPGRVGIHEPTRILHEPYVVTTGSHVSDDDAYKIAQVLYEAQDKLAAVVRAYADYSPKELTRDPQFPFHPGAIRYYKEKGLWTGK